MKCEGKERLETGLPFPKANKTPVQHLKVSGSSSWDSFKVMNLI